MVAALDESVLNITIALTEKKLINDTVIVFTTDNGGAAGHMELNIASNYPLKGGKFTVWEGGIRAVGFVYSDLISYSGNLLSFFVCTNFLSFKFTNVVIFLCRW